MLEVTPAAAEALKQMRAQVGADESAGARIQQGVTDDRQPSLSLGFSVEPEPDDQVIEQADIKVYVPEGLSPLLEQATLDVEDTPQGRVLTLR